MARDLDCCNLCLASLAWITVFGITVTSIPKPTKVMACPSRGSLTLSAATEVPGNSNVTLINLWWKCWNPESNNWTKVLYWSNTMGCFITTATLSDGTRVGCFSDHGSLTIDHSERSTSTRFNRYLFEGRLSNGSLVRRVYDVKFIECIQTWIGATFNFTDILEKRLPWKQVIDIHFFDNNNNNNSYFAYCNTKRCKITVGRIGTNSPLYWTSRLNDSNGWLLLTRIQKSDNLRDIQVKITLSSLTSKIKTELVEKSLRILVNSSLESQPSVTEKSTLRIVPSNVFSHSSFASVSQPSVSTTYSPIPIMTPQSASAHGSEILWRIVVVVTTFSMASFLYL